MIALQEPFDCFFEVRDDRGKPTRFDCRVIGITSDGYAKNFVVLSTDPESGQIAAFEVDFVYATDQVER